MKKKTIYNPTSLLLYLRSCYGLTQQQLARRCRLSCNDVCQFELRRSLTIGKLKALADFFRVSVDDLYHDRFSALPGLLRPAAPGQGGKLRECIHRRQQRCEEIGDAGERWVYELEKAKLKGTPYEGLVSPGCAQDFAAHYDLFSFDPATGEPVIIEVKSTVGGEEEPLRFSQAEWQLLNCCAEKGVRYELHRVYYVYDPKRRRQSIYTAREILKDYQAIPSDYILRRREGAA